MAAGVKELGGKPRRQRNRRKRREPAPVVIKYRCPRCGGPHPADACDKPAAG